MSDSTRSQRHRGDKRWSPEPSAVIPITETKHDSPKLTEGDLSNSEPASRMERAADSGTSPLLLLPPEIRTMIWRHATVEAETITIPPGTHPPHMPGLLQACRQTKQEGTQIYFKENRFLWIIKDMDASLYLKWCRSSLDRRQSNTVCRSKAGTKPISDNVLKWIEAFYYERGGNPAY